MSLSTNAVVKLDDLFALLGFGSGTHGEDVANLEAAIEAVSLVVRHKTNCDLVPAAAAYTAQKIDGSGSKYLYLPHWPVTVLTSVTEDDSLLVENTDFYHLDPGDLDKNRGVLERADGLNWTATQRGVLATYTAGYLIPPNVSPTIPGDLKLAALLQSAELWKRIKDKSWGKTSESAGGQTTTFSEKELLPFVAEILKKYWREEW